MVQHIVPELPILHGGAVDYPEWRQYLHWVYGEDVPMGSIVDLNSFSWFYSNSPLASMLQPMMHNLSRNDTALNTAWMCSLPFLPQCIFSPYGFFVSREPYERNVDAWTKTGRLEVLRVRFPESGAAWFYHAIGSGVFLNLNALPTPGRAIVSIGVPPDLGRWDEGVTAYMEALDCNLLVITDRFPDRRVEIVVRASSSTTSLDLTCAFPSTVFSTGLFNKQSCVCSSDVTLLNCRKDVATFLKQSASSLWTDFVLQVLFLLLVLVTLAGAAVALVLQARAAR